MSEPAALAFRHLSKSFGGVLALDDVELTVERGEVHGLLGENGSGKSTLIKVLAGRHAPSPGAELELGGRPVRLPLRPGEPRALGICFVHQDLALLPSLTVADNLRLEELSGSRSMRLTRAREREQAREDLGRLGAALDPRLAVSELSSAGRARLAIARALTSLARHRPGLLVLDETTSFLPEAERGALLELIRGLTESGSSVLLVSHDVEEARDVCDRITVLRNGCDAGTVASARVEARELIGMILGRRPRPAAPRRGEAEASPEAITIRALSGERARGVSIELREGEVVGLTGPPDSGFDEVPYLVFGALPCRDGSLVLDREHDLREISPARALRAGVVLVPAERRDGGVGSLSLADNVALPVLDRYRSWRGLRLDRARMRRATAAALERHDVRPADPGLAYGALSGGNQKRAVLAKWLQTQPRLLLLHEPTGGIDVGAREQILASIRSVAQRGAAVLCADADREELEAFCDRVLVLPRRHAAR